MYFKNDEQTREFVITIPRKNYNEPGVNHKTYKNNEAEVVSHGKSNREDGKSNQAEAVSKGKSNQAADKSNEAELRSNGKSNQAAQRAKVTNQQKDILNYCSIPRSAQEIMDRIRIDNQTNNRRRYIQALIEMGYLEPLYPETMTAANQKYIKVKRK